MEELSENNFKAFSSIFGEGCFVTNSKIEINGIGFRIPDFKVEDGKIIRLSQVEVEAEHILMSFIDVEAKLPGTCRFEWIPLGSSRFCLKVLKCKSSGKKRNYRLHCKPTNCPYHEEKKWYKWRGWHPWACKLEYEILE